MVMRATASGTGLALPSKEAILAAVENDRERVCQIKVNLLQLLPDEEMAMVSAQASVAAEPVARGAHVLVMWEECHTNRWRQSDKMKDVGMVPHSVMVTGIICGIFKVFMDLPMGNLHSDVAFCLQKTGFRPHLGLFRTTDKKCDSRSPTNNSSISQAREPSQDVPPCFSLAKARSGTWRESSPSNRR